MKDREPPRRPSAALEPAARGRLGRLIGLGVRAGTVAVGVQQVRAAARRDKLSFVLIGHDASAHSLAKVLGLLRARGITFVDILSTAELGAAVGRPGAAAVGIVDAHLARGVRDVLWSGSSGAH